MRCNEMTKGQVLFCEDCGFEVQVIKECGEECELGACCTGDISCCGKPMKLKE